MNTRRCIPTISWHSRLASFVVIILLRSFPGRQYFLLGPSSKTRDHPFANVTPRRRLQNGRLIVVSRLGKPPPRGHQYYLHPGHHCSPILSAPSRTGSSAFLYPTTSPSPLSKQLSTSGSSSGRWNPAGANANGGGGPVLSARLVVRQAWMRRRRITWQTSNSAAELRTFHCERVHKCRFRGWIRVYWVFVQDRGGFDRP